MSHTIDADHQGVRGRSGGHRDERGVALLGGGGGDGQGEVLGIAGRGLHLEIGQIGRSHRPGAVMIVGTVVQRRPGGQAGDGHRQNLRPVGIGQRRSRNGQRNPIGMGAVILAAMSRAGRHGGRRIGHRQHRHLEGRDGRGRGRAVGGGDPHRQIDDTAEIGRRSQSQPVKLAVRQGPRPIGVVDAVIQRRAAGNTGDGDVAERITLIGGRHLDIKGNDIVFQSPRGGDRDAGRPREIRRHDGIGGLGRCLGPGLGGDRRHRSGSAGIGSRRGRLRRIGGRRRRVVTQHILDRRPHLHGAAGLAATVILRQDQIAVARRAIGARRVLGADRPGIVDGSQNAALADIGPLDSVAAIPGPGLIRRGGDEPRRQIGGALMNRRQFGNAAATVAVLGLARLARLRRRVHRLGENRQIIKQGPVIGTILTGVISSRDVFSHALDPPAEPGGNKASAPPRTEAPHQG